MAFPVDITYYHDELYGTGRVVRAEYATTDDSKGDMYLTYHFPFESITREELQSVLKVVQDAIRVYAEDHGYSPMSSGTLGLGPLEVDEDDDDHTYRDDWKSSYPPPDPDEDDPYGDETTPWYRR